MTTETIDPRLEQFCRKEEHERFLLTKPFVKDGWMYATDGRWIARVRTDLPDSVPGDGDRKFVDVAKLFETSLDCTEPWPAWNGETREKECDDCGGSGRVMKTCDTCNGTGRCTCDKCGDRHDCGKCDGDGRMPTAKNCPTCLGAGWRRIPAYQKVCNRKLDGAFVKAIYELGDAKFDPSGNYDEALAFTASGGLEGRVMPVVND
jgi:hypothetical protein